MICFTGIRSFVADRFPVARHPRVLVLPVVIGTVVLGLIWVIQPMMDATIQLGLGQSTTAQPTLACRSVPPTNAPWALGVCSP
jgi:hypothetical protein